jgi:hypothetical protein
VVEHAPFQEDLGPLGGRFRVTDDSAADADHRFAAIRIDVQRANGGIPDAALAALLKTDASHRGSPRCRFALRDLHDGGAFWCAGDATGGKGRCEHVAEPNVSRQISFDRGRHRCERGILLDRKEAGRPWRGTDPAKVVAHEVDDHDVLGSVLLVAQFAQRIELAGSFHRLAEDGRSAELQKHLGTVRNNGLRSVSNESSVRHVGLRDEYAEQRRRIAFERGRERYGEVDLVHVAVSDGALDGVDVAFVFRPGRRRDQRTKHSAGGERRRREARSREDAYYEQWGVWG